MQKYYKLEDMSWIAGGTRLVKLDSLPPGKRVRKILLTFELSGTKDAADALDGQLFARAVALLKLHNFVNIPGWELQQLNHQIRGRIMMDPTDIPGSGTTFSMQFVLEIPFRDPRQTGSDDGSMPTELLMQHAIEVTFSSATVWGVGNLTLTAGTMRSECEIVEETNPPQLTQIGYEDPGGQTFLVRAGVYKDLFIVDGATPGTVTAAEIASLDLEVDGSSVWNNATHLQVIAAYNADAVRDAAGELTSGACERFPLIWHDTSGKSHITKQPAVEKQGQGQITGTMTAPRVVFWRAIPKSEDTIAAIASAINAPVEEDSVLEPAVASKSPVRAAHKSARRGLVTRKHRLISRILPTKIRRTPTPGSRRFNMRSFRRR